MMDLYFTCYDHQSDLLIQLVGVYFDKHANKRKCTITDSESNLT